MVDVSEDDTCTFIPQQIRLTPYDRRMQELRSLRDKYDEVSKQPNKERQLAQLAYLIRRAEERLEEEMRRDGDDGWRRRRDIDRWRSGDGRESRNASRRKVRSEPNEDLSHMTPEQKEQRKRDQRADANFIKRQEAKGLAASDIQARLLLRQEQRESKRGAAADSESAMTRNSAFGMF